MSHPNVFYGTKLLVDNVREMSKKGQSDEQFIPKGSYSIDEMSEDEEQAQGGYSMAANAPRQASAPAITQDYLSSVLSLLNQQQRPPQQQASQPAVQQPQTAQPNQNLAQIGSMDRNYFQNIMQQLMGQGASSQPTTSTNTQADLQTQTPNIGANISDEDIALKLEQMHEFGFLDDELNLRALQLADGNVEAAISFIIEGRDMV